MDRRGEICSDEPIGTHDHCGLGSPDQQCTRPHGVGVDGIGGLHRDVVLQKKRQKLKSLEVVCSGERATQPPTVWTKLEIVYRLRGDLEDAAVKHAIELSEEKYCSVAAILKKTAKITWRYEDRKSVVKG